MHLYSSHPTEPCSIRYRYLAATTATCLSLVLFSLMDSLCIVNGKFIPSHGPDQLHIGPTLLVGGLFLLKFSVIPTWLIVHSQHAATNPILVHSGKLHTPRNGAVRLDQ